MAKFYVYEHIRSDNQKVFYIGIGTQQKGSKKYDRAFHLNKSKRNSIWWDIFIECSKSICISIIYESDNIEEIRLKEVELIAKYGKIYDKTGCLANILDGGQINENGKGISILQYDLDGNFIKEFKDIYQACQVVECSTKNIYNCCVKKTGSARGFIWRYKTNNYPTKIERYNTPRLKRIYQFDINGNFIKEYLSSEIAERELNIDSGSIKKVCYKQRKLAGGFIWSYDKKVNPFNGYKNFVNIDKYSLDGQFIKSYDNIAEARKELNLTTSTAIRNCLTGKQKKAYGFIWKRKE